MAKKVKKKHIILGAGGTGGHMFPAEAAAHYFAAQGYEITLITDARGMRFGDNFKDYNIARLPAANIRAGGIMKRFHSVGLLLKSIWMAFKITWKIKPDVTLGFGGYPSFPAGVAAILMRRPLYLHEQNAIIGRTNKVLLRFSKKILCSFKETKGIENHKKAVFVGNPVRNQILNYIDADRKDKDKFQILVTGGSQGARIFTEIMPLCFGLLPSDMKRKIHIIHQSRPEDCAETKELYDNYNISSEVLPFIENMGDAIIQSDLVVCRSGASTLSELAALGRVGLFVPLPTSADDQQKINAEAFVKSWAGKLIEQKDLSPSLLASVIAEFFQNPDRKKKMENNTKKLGNPDAAKAIFEACIHI